MMRTRSSIVGMVVAGFVVSVVSAAGLEKKLIQYGWDCQSPAYIAEHVREMEKHPFDGIVTRADSFSNVFAVKDLDDAKTAGYMEAMASIKWGKFTDNFFMMYSRSNMDWFSERDWGPEGWVLRNARLPHRRLRQPEVGCPDAQRRLPERDQRQELQLGRGV